MLCRGTVQLLRPCRTEWPVGEFLVRRVALQQRRPTDREYAAARNIVQISAIGENAGIAPPRSLSPSRAYSHRGLKMSSSRAASSLYGERRFIVPASFVPIRFHAALLRRRGTFWRLVDDNVLDCGALIPWLIVGATAVEI